MIDLKDYEVMELYEWMNELCGELEGLSMNEDDEFELNEDDGLELKF